ncbi:phage tail tube assembly chaperone [Pediococcus pentosaceus]|uniref:phage tail tube assembly chaperone n=1 Tax=Pediococcus pentosaceus TaxID=1255 RepID=UPI0010499BA7|nr:phage tail tube assembly chaperone [Pediococcus pentosaceus]
MKIVNIKIKELGMKKPVKVAQSVANTKLINAIQLTLLKLQDDHSDDMTEIEQLEHETELLNEIEHFFKEFLKLSDKQIEKAEEELDPQELSFAIGEATARFQGATDKDVEQLRESLKEEQEQLEDPLAKENASDKSE